MKNKGFVYILSNDSMKEGIYKIGLTRRPIEQRLKELGRATGVIGGFKCEYLISTNDCCRLEKLAHNHFAEFRIDKGREFFNVDLYKIIDFLKKVETEVLLRNQHEITKRLCEINNIDLFMKNLNDELDEFEEIETGEEVIVNEYINVFIDSKHGNCKGIFNTETKKATISSGKVSILKQEDFLGYSTHTMRKYKTMFNHQVELLQNGYIDHEGNIVKPIEISINKGNMLITRSVGGNAWHSWKIEETNEPLEKFKN